MNPDSLPRGTLFVRTNERNYADIRDSDKAAAHPSNQVPEGWKLVPIEPTAGMHGAGDGAAGASHYCRCGGTWIAGAVWKAMLAASAQAVPSEQPIAEQPKSAKANSMVAVGSDLPPARSEDPQAVWRAIGDEAECVVQQGRKYLLLSEEMCMRLGGSLGM